MRRAFAAAAVACLLTLTLTGGLARAGVTPGTQYVGNSYLLGISGVTVAGNPVSDQTFFGSGALPTAGGSLSNTAATVTLPDGLGSATVVSETASGTTNTATAASTLNGITILPGQGAAGSDVLDATVLNAAATTSCTGAPLSAVSVASLTIDGVSVTLTNTANQVVSIPNVASVTIEQTAGNANTNTASSDDIVVTFPPTGTLASVITGTLTISHANSSVLCPPLTVTKTVNGQNAVSVAAGTQVTYDISLTNQVSSDCSLQTVTDALPPQTGEGGVPFTFVSGAPAGSTAVLGLKGTQNLVTWTFSPAHVITTGATFSFSFVAQAPANEPAGTYTNDVSYTSDCGPGASIQSTSPFVLANVAAVTVPPTTTTPPPTTTTTTTTSTVRSPVPSTGTGDNGAVALIVTGSLLVLLSVGLLAVALRPRPVL